MNDLRDGMRDLNRFLRELEQAQRSIDRLQGGGQHRPPNRPYHGGQYGQPPRYTPPRHNGPSQRELETLACFRDPNCLTQDEARGMRSSGGGVDLNEFWSIISSYDVQGKAFTPMNKLTQMATSCLYNGNVGNGEKLAPNTPQTQAEACFMVNEQLNRRGGRW